MKPMLEDKARILIVDDDRTMRLLLRHALERDDYEVSEAPDGVQALEVFQQIEPDIVLMDAAMPEMDGFSACDSLQRLPGGKDTPVLMITGLNDDASVERAFDAGATDYITKPVNWAVLRQRVRRMVNERRAERHVSYLAYHDSLTGLPNRTLFIERLEQNIARARRNGIQAAVLFMDLDGFKLVNDTLGHDVGDLLLKAVSERLITCLRESDTVARLGGDEFTAIITDVEGEGQIGAAARRVLNELTSPIVLNGQEVFIGVSIGIAVYPADGADVRTLLRSADMAMYRAKESGRNNYQFYTPDMGDRALARVSLENNLRRGIENEEFQLAYQPIIDLPTRKVHSLEALVQWDHPQHGLISSDKFVRLAEETGLIVPLGQWVMRNVCQQINAWRLAGVDTPPVSINVSGKELGDQELPNNLRELMASHDLAPEALMLELTEDSLMTHFQSAEGTLQELRSLGLALSIDEFGTGYCSLSHLTKLPIQALKIDRSFVQQAPNNREYNATVQAVVALARSLGFRVVANGVEQGAQLEHVRGLGCHLAQGSYYGPPVGALQAAELLERGLETAAA